MLPYLRILPHLQRRSGNRPVVGQHPDRRVTEALGDQSDPQLEMLTVGQLDSSGARATGSPVASVGKRSVGSVSVCRCIGLAAPSATGLSPTPGVSAPSLMVDRLTPAPARAVARRRVLGRRGFGGP